MIWYDMIWYDMMSYDMMSYDMMSYDMIWYDIIWCHMIWYDMMSYDMIWYDMMWYPFPAFSSCTLSSLHTSYIPSSLFLTSAVSFTTLLALKSLHISPTSYAPPFFFFFPLVSLPISQILWPPCLPLPPSLPPSLPYFHLPHLSSLPSLLFILLGSIHFVRTLWKLYRKRIVVYMPNY